MIGDFAVGKTSLVARYVHSTFSENYLTTIGVKIDSKLLNLPSGDPLKLVVWDMAGTDAMGTVESHYLQGAAGYLLVCDSTRRDTLESAISLQQQAERLIGPKPFALLINKTDLNDRYDLSKDSIQGLQSRNWPTVSSSARLGTGVEKAFAQLGEKLLGD